MNQTWLQSKVKKWAQNIILRAVTIGGDPKSVNSKLDWNDILAAIFEAK